MGVIKYKRPGHLGTAKEPKIKNKHTFTQHPAISSIIFSKRAQSAAVHCGAVIFVGSVLRRDLYMGGDWGAFGAESGTGVQDVVRM